MKTTKNKLGITTIKFDGGGELDIYADPEEIKKSGFSPYPVSHVEMMIREHRQAMERNIFRFHTDPNDLFLQYCYLIENTELSLIHIDSSGNFPKLKGFYRTIQKKNFNFVRKCEDRRLSAIPTRMLGLLNPDTLGPAIPYGGGLSEDQLNEWGKLISDNQ